MHTRSRFDSVFNIWLEHIITEFCVAVRQLYVSASCNKYSYGRPTLKARRMSHYWGVDTMYMCFQLLLTFSAIVVTKNNVLCRTNN